MLSESNEVLSGPYFALASMVSESEKKTQPVDFENNFWAVSYNDNINFKSPVNNSTYRAGEFFSSELLKNKSSEKHGNHYWEMVSFNKEQKVNDQTSTQELNIDNLEEWVSIPFGGIFASYRK